jgi:hypothetical protein
MQKQMSIELATEGLSFKTKNGNSILPWADIYSWRESNEYILIYIAPKMYHTIPVRLGESGFPIKELKSELSSHVGIAT